MEEARREGREAWEANDMARAIESFGRAIALGEAAKDPDLYKLYSNRSAAYLKSNNEAAALRDSERTIELNPEWSKGYGRKGTALLKLGHLAEATEAYSKGLELDPNNEDLRLGLADANKRRSGTSAGASSADGTTAFYRAKNFAVRNARWSARFIVGVLALFSFMTYVLPGGSPSGYWRGCFLNVVNIFIGIHGAHGMPKKSADYWRGLIVDENVHQLFPAFLFLMQRPYPMGVFPILLLMLIQVLWFLSCVLQVMRPDLLSKVDSVIGPPLAKFAAMPNQWHTTPVNKRWEYVTGKGKQVSSRAEVSFGFFLLFELLLPRRNFIMFFLYWQVLRMKYMLESLQGRPGRTQLAFRTVHEQISAILRHPRCPGILYSLYTRLSGFLASMAKLPEMPADGQRTAAPTMPKCVIM